jgi:hypothetical protein
VRRTQKRVAKHLQQLALNDEPARRNRLLVPRDLPQPRARDAGLTREPCDGDGVAESDDRIAGCRRAHDGALAHQGRADDGEPGRGGDDDRGPVGNRLREALPDAFREEPGVVPVLPEHRVERRLGRRALEDPARRVVQPHREAGRRTEPVEGRPPRCEVE